MDDGIGGIINYVKDLIDNQKANTYMAAILQIDDFDSIREKFGDEIAARIMRDVDDMLEKILGERIRYGRIHDDRFLVVIENLEYKDQMRSYARPIKFGVRRIAKEDPVLVERGISLGCSIGAAAYPKDVQDSDELLDLAYKMSDLAREKGGDRYIIYYPDLHYQYIFGNGSIITDPGTFYKYKKLMVINHFLSKYADSGDSDRMDILESLALAFQLDAVFFYDGKCRERFLVYGSYSGPESADDYYIDQDYYFENFREDGLFLINDVERMRAFAPVMYGFFKKRGFEQALEYTDDGLNVNEKMSVISFCRGDFVSIWSETDSVFLGLVADQILRGFRRSDAVMAVQAESIRNQARINSENIEGLSLGYMGVFSGSLSRNLLEVIRADGYTRSFRAFVEREKDMDRIFRDIGEKYVVPGDKTAYFEGIDFDNIARRLSETDYFDLNIRMASVPEEIHYFKFQFARIGDGGIVDRFILGVSGMDEAVQEEKKKNELLQNLLKEAEQANVAKNKLLSNMSHDLRTPLNAILVFLTLIGSHLDDHDKVCDYLNKIRDSASVMLNLCNNALNLIRLESSRDYLDEKEEEISLLIDKLKAFALPFAEKKKQSITFNCNVRHPRAVFDIAKVEEILTIILKNAIMYTPEEGHIQFGLTEVELTAQRGFSSFEIVIRDDGVGMSPEFQKTLFDAFERERNTTEAGFYGSGLGLAIAKNIVDMMNGSIECRSACGEGTEFTVRLQLMVADDKEESDDKTAFSEIGDNADPFKGKRFLVVDDNELNTEITTELLGAMGAETETASDGAEALEKIRNMAPGQIDVVLMDAQMPVMNGYEATMAIRNLECGYQREIVILGLSANAFADDCEEGIRAGMDGYLAKPLDMSVLREELIKHAS